MAHSVRELEVDGVPALALCSDELEAAFAPGLGMIGCSLRHEGEELLELRGGLDAYAEKGSTRGIPLLHPWANRVESLRFTVAGQEVDLERHPELVHTDPAGLPMHGLLAASSEWAITEHGADEGGALLAAELDFGAHPVLLEAFPFPHAVAIEASVTAAVLTITTTLWATGDVAVPVSFGFHPYVRLPGIERRDWLVTLPARRRLELDERMLPAGGASEALAPETGPLAARDLDHAFDSIAEGAEFAVEGGGRRIAVRFTAGYPCAQIYAPADRELICFEPMTAPTNGLVTGGEALRLVEPGGSFSASFEIAVSDRA